MQVQVQKYARVLNNAMLNLWKLVVNARTRRGGRRAVPDVVKRLNKHSNFSAEFAEMGSRTFKKIAAKYLGFRKRQSRNGGRLSGSNTLTTNELRSVAT